MPQRVTETVTLRRLRAALGQPGPSAQEQESEVSAENTYRPAIAGSEARFKVPLSVTLAKAAQPEHEPDEPKAAPDPTVDQYLDEEVKRIQGDTLARQCAAQSAVRRVMEQRGVTHPTLLTMRAERAIEQILNDLAADVGAPLKLGA